MPVTVQHAKTVPAADFTGTVTVLASNGVTATALATNLVRPQDWNSAHALTLSLSASELTPILGFNNGITSSTSAGGITAGIRAASFMEAFPLHNTNSTLSAPGIGTWYLDGPYNFPNGIASGQLANLVSNAAAFLNGAVFSAAVTGSVTRNQSFYNQWAIYKHGLGASTSRLESVWTGSIGLFATWVRAVTSTATSHVRISNGLTLSFPSQFDASGGVTYGSTGQSGTTESTTSTVASTFADNLITGAKAYLSGARMDMIPFATSLPAGEYWFAHMFTSTSSSAGTGYSTGTMHSTHSRLGLLENLVNAYKRLGVSVSDSTTNVVAFHGYLATTTSQASGIINLTDVRGTSGRAYWNIDQRSF